MLVKRAAEIRTFTHDFRHKLHADELLSGTPTIAEIGSSDLTIGNIELTTTPTDIIGTPFIPTDYGVQFQVTGGTAGTTYTLRITATTDATYAQTLIDDIELRVN